jgi:hypothetical protein
MLVHTEHNSYLHTAPNCCRFHQCWVETYIFRHSRILYRRHDRGLESGHASNRTESTQYLVYIDGQLDVYLKVAYLS